MKIAPAATTSAYSPASRPRPVTPHGETEDTFRFAPRYTQTELMHNPDRAAAFVTEYLNREARFFDIARHPDSGLTYDGWNLDERTGKLAEVRYWSAPSKECLDMGLLIKALRSDPVACRVVGHGQPATAAERAIEILGRKISSYEAWNRDNPGYGGFLPWFNSGARAEPTWDWPGEVPGLDNGEWVWSMLLAEKGLREAGQGDLADRYHKYNEMLRTNAVRMFYDPAEGKVRGDVRVLDTTSSDSTYETIRGKPGRQAYLTGEHGVHEGVMMVLYLTLMGKGLPPEASDRIWSGIHMNRRENSHGSTWEAFWGSAHESWAYLFLPFRDLPEYRDLFRIREEIRTGNAAERGYPGLATSTNRPGPTTAGYLDGAGIEGIGSQPIRNNHVFAVYGAFPALLEFAGHAQPWRENYGLEWLHNMLCAPRMQGPYGGGESATNDGTTIAPMKTIDGSFPIVLAMAGGLEHETADLLREHGVYERFVERMRGEYREAFGSQPLLEEPGFALPTTMVPTDRMPDFEQPWLLVHPVLPQPASSPS